MSEPAILIGGPHEGKQIDTAANTIETVFVTPERIFTAEPRPSWWRHPVRYRRWTPPPPSRPAKMIQLRYVADGSRQNGRRVFRLASDWQPYRGPEAADDGELYKAVVHAMYAVHPAIRQDQHTRWVMNLDWWKQCRREAARQTGEDDDEDNWKPSPDDHLLGMKLTVTEDGGRPHLENPHYPAGWPS